MAVGMIDMGQCLDRTHLALLPDELNAVLSFLLLVSQNGLATLPNTGRPAPLSISNRAKQERMAECSYPNVPFVAVVTALLLHHQPHLVICTRARSGATRRIHRRVRRIVIGFLTARDLRLAVSWVGRALQQKVLRAAVVSWRIAVILGIGFVRWRLDVITQPAPFYLITVVICLQITIGTARRGDLLQAGVTPTMYHKPVR